MPGDVKENAPAWAHAVAGQIAGMVGLMVVHPIDTVKIRMQARVSAPPVSAVSTVSSLMQREGPMALYRGIGAPMVAYGLINAVAFTTHTEVVRLLRGELGGSGGSPLVKDPYLIGLAGGAAAGFTSSFVRGPAERVKTVQQVAESSCGTGKVPEKYRGTIPHSGDVGKGTRPAEGLVHGYGRDRGSRNTSVRGLLPHLRFHTARLREGGWARVRDGWHSPGRRQRRGCSVGGHVPSGRH